MKHSITLLMLCLGIIACSGAFAQDVPYLGGRVNDTAHMLSAATITELETALKAYEDSTTNQLVVLTIESLGESTIEEYSLKVAQTWKLGKKGVDNGALLCIAKDDRKIRIEVGYGLEASLTDALTSFIIRTKITPRFKEQDFNAGVREGVYAMIAGADGTLEMTEGSSESAEEMPLWGALFFCSIWFSVVGLFTVIGLGTKGFQGWFLYVFLLPFYGGGAAVLGSGVLPELGMLVFAVYLIGYPILKFLLPATTWGTKFITATSGMRGSSGGSWSSGSGSGRSSGSSFSGGGGSFGGGGSSGGW